jgi:hypothetical protein
MSDTLEKIGNSQIQHGPDNDRIYLIKLDPADLPDIADQLDALATERGYTKICKRRLKSAAGGGPKVQHFSR